MGTEVRKKKQMVIKQLIEETIELNKKQALFEDEMDIQDILATDEEFKFNFRKAISYYISGDWLDATKLLKKCLMLRPRDGPTFEIYRFIEQHNFKAPTDWKGYRDISERLAHLSV